MNIAILGAGAWGSALAISLAAAHRVSLWTRRPEDRDHLRATRASRYLPEARLPASVTVESELARAVDGAQLAIVATATAGLRAAATALRDADARMPMLWACKGFEQPSQQFPHEVVAAVQSDGVPVGALSGPSFAAEVARGLPTAVLLASRDGAFAAATMAQLNSARLRIYSSTDLVGVELGGAVKNVIAIAAGIADGLALGHNARAALITRGLAETARLGVALGGQAETFMGLAGLGDLVLTCTGELSRNRRVGVELAGGKPLAEVLRDLGHVAEGVPSAPAVLAHAQRAGVEMPITASVCAVLEGRIDPRGAVERLLSRDPRPE